MSDFKVGDKVRLAAESLRVHTVVEVGNLVPGGQIVHIENDADYWYPAETITLVPPEKPKYRLDTSQHAAHAKVDDMITATVYYGPTEAADCREHAEAMVRAAMTALGYEEAK